jgi:uncharacterized Zn-binding protein involved in type VI secretion
MPVTVNINGLSVIHQRSGGVATATVPDVCKTPSPAGPIPIPYSNVAQSSDLVDGTSTVTIDGSSAAILGSKFAKSTGDEAGSAGGVVSGVFAMEASFLSFSPTVMIDGKPACRLTDKMLMNKGNTVCMAGAFNPVVLPATPETSPDTPGSAVASLLPESPKRCVLRSVVASCGHSARKLRLDLSRKDVQVFQVISNGSEPDKLIVEWDGNCGDHHSFCPTIGVSSAAGWKVIDKATAIVELPAPQWILLQDWAGIFRMLVRPRDVTRDYHTIISLLCMGHDAADVRAGQWLQVQVFPEVGWKATGEMSYSHEKVKNSRGKEDPFKYEEGSTWTIGGSVEATYGKNKFSYALEAEQHADHLPLFGSLVKLIGSSAIVLDSMGTFGASAKLKPRWPKWSFEGELKLVELSGKPVVATEGSFKFSTDPLFGLEMEVSILDWLIRFAGDLAGPPGILLAEILVEIRKRFAKGAGDATTFGQASLDIDIALTVGGLIKGGIGVKFVDGKSEVDNEVAELQGSVDIKIEGHVIGVARAWRFEASGAGKVGAGSADGKEPSTFGVRLRPKGGEDALKPKVGVFFNGLAFYYLLYLEVGALGAESEKKDANEEEYGFNKKKVATHKLFEKKGTCVLMKPWAWPKEGE